MAHPEEGHLVSGAALKLGNVEHVALSAPAPVEELVDMQNAQCPCPPAPGSVPPLANKSITTRPLTARECQKRRADLRI